MKRILFTPTVWFCLAAVPVVATHPVQDSPLMVLMSGQNEIGPDGRTGAGDPDGIAVARLFEDHGDLGWSIDYSNISGAAISGLHIHGPGSTPATNRPVFIDLIQDLTAPPPLPNGKFSGRVSSFRDPTVGPKIQQVFANPQEFYINLHTSGAGGFPLGAVRGQLPEPSAAGAFAAVAALALLRHSRGGLHARSESRAQNVGQHFVGKDDGVEAHAARPAGEGDHFHDV